MIPPPPSNREVGILVSNRDKEAQALLLSSHHQHLDRPSTKEGDE